MKCPDLNLEITRKENDFYFLRDLLLKLYPATIVRINYIIIKTLFFKIILIMK